MPYAGSGKKPPLILDLNTRCLQVAGFKLQPLFFLGKSHWYPLNRRLGGLQSQTGYSGEQKNLLPFSGTKHKSSVFQPMAIIIPTMLSLCCKTYLPTQSSSSEFHLHVHVYLLYPAIN
jgi:hypothetical protein